MWKWHLEAKKRTISSQQENRGVVDDHPLFNITAVMSQKYPNLLIFIDITRSQRLQFSLNFTHIYRFERCKGSIFLL